MADVSVRPARPDDAARIARMQVGTWRAAYSDLLPSGALDVPEEQVAAAWRRAAAEPPSPRHHVLVALEGPDLVGLAASEPVPGGDAVELSALLVEPARGRRGHGSRLLAAAVENWRADGAGTALTWVWEADVASTAFLGSAGWAPDGATRALDDGPRQLRLHVSLDEAP